jgi:hypothetical protein
LNTQKHTSGPWHIGKRYPSGAIYDEKGGEVCGFSNLLHPAEIAANARLIAAAPELLDMLFLALPYVEEAENDPCNKKGAVRKLVDDIRAALAKAEGEQ